MNKNKNQEFGNVPYSNLDAGNQNDYQSIQVKGKFQFSRQDLSELSQPTKGPSGEALKILNENGGINQLQKVLNTDFTNGINTNDAVKLQQRKQNYGENTPYIKPIKSLFEMIKDQFEDFMLRLLVVAAIVNLIVGILKDGIEHGWLDGVSIVVAILIIVIVGSGNNYMKEKQFQNLMTKYLKDSKNTKIKRDGQIQYITSAELLVGDLLYIQVGDIFPVDGILLEGQQLLIDESSLTGETDLMKKDSVNSDPYTFKENKSCPFVYSGTQCMDGSGIMLVTVVGNLSNVGKIRELLQEENQITPLQLKLEKIASQIGKGGTFAALLTFFALLIHLIIKWIYGEIQVFTYASLTQIINCFMLSITIIVAAVPEGLPLSVNIALAYAVGKMKDENNFVRKLQSCEIMGGANEICTDKTGTLTQNRMTTTKLFIQNKIFNQNDINPINLDKNLVHLLCDGICFNSDATPEFDGEQRQLGNKTECALLEMANRLGYNYNQKRDKSALHKQMPFNSSRKKMMTIIKIKNGDYRVYVKGASEIILGQSHKLAMPNSDGIPINNKDIKEVIEQFAFQSLRTIGLAYKDLSSHELQNLTDEMLDTRLTLIGIAGIKDPLRDGVREAITKCKNAGINVRMVTGDNKMTAQAIAKDCGILEPSYDSQNQGNGGKYSVMEALDFRNLVGGVDENKKIRNFDMFKQIVSQLRVLARSQPEDKYVLVTGLIQMGQVVAVTGDGTNDAPALKKADIGFAMGIAGTEVSKEAADIILLDDNFSSILTACKWGRNIYDSIRKFLQFQLTVNVVALFIAFIGGVVINGSPLNAIQLLWINLIMDTFASLALATEPPTEDLLDRQPYTRTESIVDISMIRNIIGQSIYQITTLCILLFLGPSLLNIPNGGAQTAYSQQGAKHFTLIFQTFVMMQVFNQFNSRKIGVNEYNVFKNLFNNHLFFIIQVIIVFVQILLIQYGGASIKVSKLTFMEHLMCALLGLGTIPFALLFKLVPINMFKGIARKISDDSAKEANLEELDKQLVSQFRRKASQRFSQQQNKLSKQVSAQQLKK